MITQHVADPRAKWCVRPRKLKYLRQVLEVMYEDETLSMTSGQVPKDLLLLALHQEFKPVSLAVKTSAQRRVEVQQPNNGTTWQVGIDSGTIFLFHDSGVIVELTAGSNGWFRIRDAGGQDSVLQRASTVKWKQPLNKLADSLVPHITLMSDTQLRASTWSVHGMTVTNTKDGGKEGDTQLKLTPQGDVIVKGIPV